MSVYTVSNTHHKRGGGVGWRWHGGVLAVADWGGDA